MLHDNDHDNDNDRARCCWVTPMGCIVNSVEQRGDVLEQPAVLQESPDFSLVLGGPVFQFFRRTHLSGTTLELLYRRALVITAVAWLPLAILSLASGRTFGSAVALPFLRDIETQARFLVALPILIAAELIVHIRLRLASNS